MSEEMKNTKTVEEAGAVTEQTREEENTTPEEKKYTDSDVDKIVSKKIARERERMRKIFEEEQQENELEARERKILTRELQADAKDKLISEGLPYTLASLMSYEDKERFEESYKEVTTIFREAVQRGIKDVLRGPTPKASVRPIEGDEIAKIFHSKR